MTIVQPLVTVPALATVLPGVCAGAAGLLAGWRQRGAPAAVARRSGTIAAWRSNDPGVEMAGAGSSIVEFEAVLAPVWSRAQAGDEPAYRQCLQLIAGRLRGYFRRRLQSLPDEVEDLVQETLLALHLHRGSCDPATPVSAWVLAIARHKLVDLWRRRGRQEALHDPLDDVPEDDLAAEPESAGTQRDLALLLDELPQAQRVAIVLTKIEGLSVLEASQRTGVSESAIKVQVHRGLKRLASLVKGSS